MPGMKPGTDEPSATVPAEAYSVSGAGARASSHRHTAGAISVASA